MSWIGSIMHLSNFDCWGSNSILLVLSLELVWNSIIFFWITISLLKLHHSHSSYVSAMKLSWNCHNLMWCALKLLHPQCICYMICCTPPLMPCQRTVYGLLPSHQPNVFLWVIGHKLWELQEDLHGPKGVPPSNETSRVSQTNNCQHVTWGNSTWTWVFYLCTSSSYADWCPY
jgi:hypothetical protein